jgi:hypothetical protein
MSKKNYNSGNFIKYKSIPTSLLMIFNTEVLLQIELFSRHRSLSNAKQQFAQMKLPLSSLLHVCAGSPEPVAQLHKTRLGAQLFEILHTTHAKGSMHNMYMHTAAAVQRAASREFIFKLLLRLFLGAHLSHVPPPL